MPKGPGCALAVTAVGAGAFNAQTDPDTCLTGGAHLELFSVKANGDKVLLNDVANGGFKTYREGVAPVKSLLTVSTTIPNGLTGTPLTGVVTDTATKTITADIPTSGKQGFLTITPAVSLLSVQTVGGKLVIKYQ